MKPTKENVTVNYLGIDFDVFGNYYPEEPMVRYYPDGSGYPGSSSEFEITSIEINGQDAEELIDKLNVWDEITELSRQKIED